MTRKSNRTFIVLASLLPCVIACESVSALAADAETARAVARRNECFKCHAVDKKKQGPAWRDVAAKYRGKADAQAKLIVHLTSGEVATFDDGHQEQHKIVDPADDAEINNLVDWILEL